MKSAIYNLAGERVGDIDLPDEVFRRKWNPDLVHQALIAQTANKRKIIAHTKGRGEVRGGGIKPWRQKGTGRARHGSIRSPIWIGGGVTHGPTKEKSYGQKINKKMRRAAILSVLSKKLKEDEVKIIDSLKMQSGKTKILDSTLKIFLKQPKNSKKLSVLLVPGTRNSAIHSASMNIPKVKALGPSSLNVEDLLKFKNILIDKEALSFIK